MTLSTMISWETSPASSTAPETTFMPEAIVHGRQDGSGPDNIVTLSITKDTTTYTTLIQLGNSELPPPTPTLTTGSQPSSTIASPGTSTTGVVIIPANPNSPNGLSSTTVAIIVGSVIGGVLFLVLLWIWLCVWPRRVILAEYDSETVYSMSEVERVERVRVERQHWFPAPRAGLPRRG